jgi:hypothetical protein
MGSEWQPINTAPRDGTIVLGGHLFQGRWLYRLAKWNEYHQAFNQYPAFHRSPSTHWMPLPDPPKS